jgi:hypothetical protein
MTVCTYPSRQSNTGAHVDSVPPKHVIQFRHFVPSSVETGHDQKFVVLLLGRQYPGSPRMSVTLPVPCVQMPPLGQVEHTGLFSTVPLDKYVPSGQTQSLMSLACDPVRISKGDTHAVHLDEAAAAYSTSGVALHERHAVAPGSLPLALPAGHATQLIAPSCAAMYPAGHSSHDVGLMFATPSHVCSARKLPASQFSHFEFSRSSLLCSAPPGHSLQDRLPRPAAKNPAGHCAQSLISVFDPSGFSSS